MPFRVVDQEDFRDFIRDLNPKYKLPNRHKVAAAVLELYVEDKAKIKSVIEGLRGDDIGRCLEVCLNDWGIDKVFSIIVDNASANDTAIAYMKRRLKSNVKDRMTELSREIDAIRNCVKFIHSSSARLESFREYCVLLRFDRMSSIPFDVVTRWNATYQMLNSAFKFKEKVSKEVDGVTRKAKRVGHPEVDDWESTVIALQVEIEEQISNASNSTLQSVATSMKLKFDKY
ncbi:hypothetical protein FF2_015717 [Malus domestica]